MLHVHVHADPVHVYASAVLAAGMPLLFSRLLLLRSGSGSRLKHHRTLEALVRRSRKPREAATSVEAGTSETALDVEVHDEFFPAETQAEILRLMERPRWSFTGGRPPNHFWHMDGLQEEPFFGQQLLGQICARLGRRFEAERIYANGQTALQTGAPHLDDGDMTFLYYPNPRWKVSWNGSLLFLRNGALASVVQYRPNRALLFPAGLVHYADAPSKEFPGLRVSLAYKLRLPPDS